MGQRIRIEAGGVVLAAELNDTETAREIAGLLPVEGTVRRWGREIYFEIPLERDLEKDNSREEMEVGDLGYWPAGKAFCIFFGRTPASTSDKPRAASAVTVVGRVEGEAEVLDAAGDGDKVALSEE